MSYWKYSRQAISLLIFLPAVLNGQRAPKNAVPLKNWSTPLYWQPNQVEREVAAQSLPQTASPQGAAPQLVFSANAVSTNALTFVAITPCRLVDTRGGTFNGISPFSGPSIPPMGTITIPVQSATEASTNTTPAPCGTIPFIAQAYSLNLTVVPVAGGAVDYVSMWPSGYPQPFVATLNDPQGAIVANAAIVPAGLVSGGISVYNQGPATANVIIDMNGFFAAPTDVNNNTAIGAGTLQSNTTGFDNVAVGLGAMQNNTTGNQNTAVGDGALLLNTTGYFNTAAGLGSLSSNTTGNQNTASGTFALQTSTTGNDNTADGFTALQKTTTGSQNTATGSGALFSNTTGNNNTAGGYQALEFNTTGSNNTATGQQALQDNTTGGGNTASGTNALQNNTTGGDNTAGGFNALQSNTTGSFNTAGGVFALQDNTTGGHNTASGEGALAFNTAGNNNTASGGAALLNNSTGGGNTATGEGALQNNTTGGNNIAVGFQAAYSVSGGNSNNIHIGTQGIAGDSAIIRIGTVGTQTSTYIAGISGATPGTPNLLVCVDGNGQLGTTGCSSTPSSQRFKEQITDMGDSSSKLLQLRPVTFLYKPEYDDGSHTLQYGLIAEEVAKVYPDMVGYDKDGQPSSVKYQSLAPMLLNEVQKQAEQIRGLQGQSVTIQTQSELIRSLQDRLAALEALQPSAATRPASSQ